MQDCVSCGASSILVIYPNIMKRVYQKLDSDCLSACIASITDLSIDDIPTFISHDWFRKLRTWMFAKGYQTTRDRTIDQSYHIACVDAFQRPDGASRCHAVVYKNIWPIHDPAELTVNRFSTFEHQVLSRISIRPLNYDLD